MDSNSKRRMKWRQEEMERRRTDRARQRSEIMSQRRQAAQTAYMQRMGNKVGGEAGKAIAMGETRREYVTAQDQLQTAQAQRGLMADQGYAARTTADANMRTADAGYLTAEQRPAMQAAQIAADQQLEVTRGDNANRVATTTGEYGIRQGQLGVAAARAEAQAARDAATIQGQYALQAQRETPFVTEAGVVRRKDNGSYTMDAFPAPGLLDQAEADYQSSSALGKVWKDPIRALVPFYDPKINE